MNFSAEEEALDSRLEEDAELVSLDPSHLERALRIRANDLADEKV